MINVDGFDGCGVVVVGQGALFGMDSHGDSSVWQGGLDQDKLNRELISLAACVASAVTSSGVSPSWFAGM